MERTEIVDSLVVLNSRMLIIIVYPLSCEKNLDLYPASRTGSLRPKTTSIPSRMNLETESRTTILEIALENRNTDSIVSKGAN